MAAAAYREQPALRRQNPRLGDSERIGIKRLARDEEHALCPKELNSVAVHVGYFNFDAARVVHDDLEFQRLVGESALRPFYELRHDLLGSGIVVS